VSEDKEKQKHTVFSAADAALGYLYQCRLGLLLALRRARSGADFLLYIESLDDVVFTHEDGLELLQTKHHKGKAANLADASPDLWKTLRVWSEGTNNGTILPYATLNLITTAAAGAGSAASYLRNDNRNVLTAAERLRSTAQTSSNQANQLAYFAFLELGEDGQWQLLNRVIVLDASPNIIDLATELRTEVRWAVEREHLEPFLHRLEGWWFRRLVQQLAGGRKPILSDEFGSQMDDLRGQFKREALPIDEDILAAEVDASVYQDALFVRQLHLVGIGASRVLAAICEYFRAFEQRSRWVREDLLLVGELEKYERRLIEEWELVFARVNDESGSSAGEELKQKAAAQIYKWVEEKVIPIRPNVTEPFVTRGSYHILSDRLRVGWHPEFVSRLRHLIEDLEVIS
jgi:hypothetical protein